MKVHISSPSRFRPTPHRLPSALLHFIPFLDFALRTVPSLCHVFLCHSLRPYLHHKLLCGAHHRPQLYVYTPPHLQLREPHLSSSLIIVVIRHFGLEASLSVAEALVNVK
jgi:hypothetical protein